MVRNSHKYMFIIGHTKKPCAQGNLGSQVESVPRRLLDGLLQTAGRPCGGVDDLPTKVGPLAFDHALFGNPVGGGKQRAQTLMAADHIRKRGG